MSDDTTTVDEVDIQQVVEALLNICGQAAEMQLDEEGNSRVSYYGSEVVANMEDKPKTSLKLVVNNGDDDPETIH